MRAHKCHITHLIMIETHLCYADMGTWQNLCVWSVQLSSMKTGGFDSGYSLKKKTYEKTTKHQKDDSDLFKIFGPSYKKKEKG